MIGIRFLDAAAAELYTAVESYGAISRDLGADLLAEIDSASARIRAFPKHGSPYLHGTRRIVLRGFPFQMVYVEESGQTVVVAFAHQRREPGYWRNRL